MEFEDLHDFTISDVRAISMSNAGAQVVRRLLTPLHCSWV